MISNVKSWLRMRARPERDFGKLSRRLIHASALLCLLAAGCTVYEQPLHDQKDPLLHNSVDIARADRLVIFVPGSLTSITMYGPADGWSRGGFADAYYRFPGLDGMPVTPLDIEGSARRIAGLANRYPDKEVALVGYSSGAAIAILAAAQIAGDRVVPVAAISPAVERGGGMPTLVRGASDIVRSAARAKSLDPVDVWIEYWQILLRGRNAAPIPEFRERVIETARTHRGETNLGPPEKRLAQSHARYLRSWELPENLDLSKVRLRIYVGLEDPVFSINQTLRFARQLGAEQIYGYPGEGHLLYLTQSDVFETARRFAEEVFATEAPAR